MKVLLIILLLANHAKICLASDPVEERIKRLEEKVVMLEKQLTEQQYCIEKQDSCIKTQQNKIDEYEKKLSSLDEQLHRQVAAPVFTAEGFRIGAGATMIVQGTNNSNTAGQENRDRTDASYSADVTIQKEFSDLNSRAFIHLEAGQGAGIEDQLTVFSNVNRDADNDNNVRLTEAWYEQGLFADRAALVFGKLDPTVYFDNNEVANDETTQFLARIFCGSPVIEFPDNTAGIRMAVMPYDWLELSYGLLDGNSDWEKMFDNLFNIGQVNFKTNFFGLSGNYRLLGWNNEINHTKWLDTEKDKESNYGFGLSFDQKVNDIVTLFTRYGWENPRVYNPNVTATGGFNYSLEYAWSTGFQIAGKPWGRQKDILGFAIGQAIPSDEYRKADSSRDARKEGHLETYYNIRVNDSLFLSPDFQYIWNPFGRDIADDNDGIFVGGIRTQIDF